MRGPGLYIIWWSANLKLNINLWDFPRTEFTENEIYLTYFIQWLLWKAVSLPLFMCLELLYLDYLKELATSNQWVYPFPWFQHFVGTGNPFLWRVSKWYISTDITTWWFLLPTWNSLADGTISFSKFWSGTWYHLTVFYLLMKATYTFWWQQLCCQIILSTQPKQSFIIC